MTNYSVTVFDETIGYLEVLTITVATMDDAIYKVESISTHEYEVIDIEKEDPRHV